MTAAELKARFTYMSEDTLRRSASDYAKDIHPKIQHPGEPAIAESSSVAVDQEAVKAEAGPARKFLVRLTDVRKRLLDTDNLVSKFHVDCCRYSGLLLSDAASAATITVTQRKLNPGESPHTEIEIEEV